MTTDLDRLAELGRAVEKTREPFSPGMAGLSWYDEGERDSDFLSLLIESLRAALAERIASELALAEECERLRSCGNCDRIGIQSYEDEDGFVVDLTVCGPEDVDLADPCHFTPSRWEPRRDACPACAEEAAP